MRTIARTSGKGADYPVFEAERQSARFATLLRALIVLESTRLGAAERDSPMRRGLKSGQFGRHHTAGRRLLEQKDALDADWKKDSRADRVNG